MSDTTLPIRRALLSVTDKTGLDVLGKELAARKVEIVSSGGTARFLTERGIGVRDLSEYTGDPEMLDGRLKTLHPKIHAGILAVRTNEAHLKQLEARKYPPIDLVVVNLYPFELALEKAGNSFDDVVEEIDIGGPAMLRAAAKNFRFVTALSDPAQYEEFLREFEANDGATTVGFRRACARRAFERSAAYDVAISGHFRGEEAHPPERYALALKKKWDMRYGENPHQKAAFYLPSASRGKPLLESLQGKALSYNNLMDVHAALDLMCEFPEGRTAAILKHTNPCGVGVSDVSLTEAYDLALACDPISAFGGIVIFSHPVDEVTAARCSETFTEIVVAPRFQEGALRVFARKKNLRLLQVEPAAARKALEGLEIRRAADGFLVQTRDRSMEDLRALRSVTRRKPTDRELRALTLAWRVCKHVKSNAVVLANDRALVGVGAGQMSRVDAARLAAAKADPAKLKGCALASDAFFPFRDGVDEAAKHGVTAVVQPGGSIRDEEVVAACDEHGLAMLLTQVRHFKH